MLAKCAIVSRRDLRLGSVIGRTDARIVESIVAQLRRIYGDRVVPPTRVHISNWHDDPFARGSSACMTVGSTTADHDALASPMGAVLHLAGEPTLTDDPATVPAALLSGHRAAQNTLGRAIALDAIIN